MLLQTLDKGAFVLIFWFQSQVLFYLLWCTQKQVWLAGSLHLFFAAPPPLSLSCKLLLSFTSNCLRSLSDEWICSSSPPFFFTTHLFATRGGCARPGPVIIQTNTARAPAGASLHRHTDKLDRCMLTVSGHFYLFFSVRACLTLSSSPLRFFFFFCIHTF